VQRANWRDVLATGLGAAVIPGLVSTILTRALMSVVAWILGRQPTFSLGPILAIAVVYIVLLLPGCLALAYRRAVWSWLIFGAGGALLLSQAVDIGREEASGVQYLPGWRWFALVVVLFFMLATYTAQIFSAARWATRAARSVADGDPVGVAE
jgi:hypothetical protein